MHNLAAQYPEKVKELADLFDSEARRNHVYPLEPKRELLPVITSGRTTFVYHAGIQRIPGASAPRLAGRPHRITADIDIPDTGASGVIVAQGGRYGGFTLYVKDGSLAYETSANGHRTGKVVSSETLPPGKVRVAVEFIPEASPAPDNLPFAAKLVPGVAKLSINGAPAGSAEISGLGASSETLDIGADLGLRSGPAALGCCRNPARQTEKYRR